MHRQKGHILVILLVMLLAGSALVTGLVWLQQRPSLVIRQQVFHCEQTQCRVRWVVENVTGEAASGRCVIDVWGERDGQQQRLRRGTLPITLAAGSEQFLSLVIPLPVRSPAAPPLDPVVQVRLAE